MGKDFSLISEAAFWLRIFRNLIDKSLERGVCPAKNRQIRPLRERPSLLFFFNLIKFFINEKSATWDLGMSYNQASNFLNYKLYPG